MSLLSELQRRNVFRVGIAYIISAWMVIQVADIVLPTFDAPEWIMQGIILLSVLGFLVVVVLAWIYELTPEGVKRTDEVSSSESITRWTGRKLDFVIIGLLCFTLIVVVIDNYVLEQEGPETAATVEENNKSIAVLPFENRSAAEENAAFFADGLHDDLLTMLSKIGDLRVISHSSVERLRDTEKSIREIGEVLEVYAILEGGVQRAGDKIRINVQLVDAKTDNYLWANVYDKELTAANIFAIQSEIAESIASSLQATLNPREQARLNNPPTKNLDAYWLYLLGKQRMAQRTSVTIAEATNYFQQATTLDPEFALAYVGLADCYALQISYSGLPEKEMHSKAEAAITTALAIDDELAEAYASLAFLSLARNDFQGAERLYRRTLQLSPNYATAHLWYGNMLAQLGRYQEALESKLTAAELDPLSPIINTSLAFTLQNIGRFDDALIRNGKSIEIDAKFARAYDGNGGIYWAAFGQLDEAVSWYRKSISMDPNNPYLPLSLGYLYLDLRDDKRAEYWFSRVQELAPESFWTALGALTLHLYRGEDTEALEMARRALNLEPRNWLALVILRNHALKASNYDDAAANYADAFPRLVNEDKPEINGSNLWQAIDLAFVYQQRGQTRRADALLSRGWEFLPSIPRLGFRGYAVSDVQVLAIRGQAEQALVKLRKAVDQGWRYRWWYYMNHDRNLDSLRSEPAFNAIMYEIKADMAEQLERVRNMERNGELEAIPELSATQ